MMSLSIHDIDLKWLDSGCLGKMQAARIFVLVFPCSSFSTWIKYWIEFQMTEHWLRPIDFYFSFACYIIGEINPTSQSTKMIRLFIYRFKLIDLIVFYSSVQLAMAYIRIDEFSKQLFTSICMPLCLRNVSMSGSACIVSHASYIRRTDSILEEIILLICTKRWKAPFFFSFEGSEIQLNILDSGAHRVLVILGYRTRKKKMSAVCLPEW